MTDSTTLHDLIGKMPVINGPTVRALRDALNLFPSPCYPKACGMSGNFMRFPLHYILGTIGMAFSLMDQEEQALLDTFCKQVRNAMRS